MYRLLGFLLVCASTISIKSVADDPVGGCRVKQSTLKSSAAIVNNSGCILTKEEGRITKFLLVYVDKGEDDKGWGFPGGSPATKANDIKRDKRTRELKATAKIADSVDFDYGEPSPCTAARETREEVGIEVVVGDRIDHSKYFSAFECFAVDKSALSKKLEANDKQEVKGIGWYSQREMEQDGFLRFKSNLGIVKKYLAKELQSQNN